MSDESKAQALRNLEQWLTERPNEYEDQVYVGPNRTVADVKRDLRTLLKDQS